MTDVGVDVLVTGANGFVGRSLVLAARERGYRVRALVSPLGDSTWLEEHDIPFVRGDICDASAIGAAVRGAGAIVHLVANMRGCGPFRASFDVNVLGTETICSAALSAGTRRLVHLSTVMVYGRGQGRPIVEDDRLDPLDEPYSVTKAAADQLVQRMIAKNRLPGVIIRSGPILGPGDRLNFGRIANRVRSGRMLIIGSGNNVVPFVYVSDIVDAILLAMEGSAAAGKTYNITASDPITQGRYLSILAAELGARPAHVHVPRSLMLAAAAAAERVSSVSRYRIPAAVTRHGVSILGDDRNISIERARRVLGFEPRVSIPEGLRLTATWHTGSALEAPTSRRPH